MLKYRLLGFGVFIGALAIAWFVMVTEPMVRSNAYFPTLLTPNEARVEKLDSYAFKLGLDLAGGTALTYKADTANIPDGEKSQALSALRDVIERRVNLFGVAEPVVQNERSEIAGEDRLIVELPGVTDINQAIKMIGETPVLEFKSERDEESKAKIRAAAEKYIADQKAGKTPVIDAILFEDPDFVSTKLTGAYLKKAQVQFDAQTAKPLVSLEFNEEGSSLFEELTRENKDKVIAIYLDGAPISTPRVNEVITGGKAVIQGDFTTEEAKLLAGRLNSGALPVAISLIGTDSVGAALGGAATEAGVTAALWGMLVVALFLVLWYRFPGIIAVLALGVYIITVLALFKFIPVTLSAAGIAGFIISIGLAVDANVLIFERMKEEIRGGKDIHTAIDSGFARAWSSIKDSNISSLITAVILFWFGTSVVKGFALTFAIGVIVSMFSALFVTRVLLKALSPKGKGALARFFFSSGLTIK